MSQLWIQDFKRFVESPNPRFLCNDADWPEQSKKYWIAKLNNKLFDSATAEEISFLKDEINAPSEFIDFFSQNNGFVLYEDTLSDAAGVYIAPIQEWRELSKNAERWFKIADDEDEEELLPSWFHNSIVIGEAPHSGNYFILVLSGEHRGSIFYFCHDGFEFEHYAINLPEFLRKITENPPEVLMHLGCYARYSDGKTDTQWIPEKYAVADESF